MAVDLAVGTPLAEALNSAVHTKLLEVGWGSEDDTSLAEFIVLMLVNGKTEDQIASELASDILPEGEGTQEFAHWLFDQVRTLQNGGSVAAATATAQPEQQSIPSFPDSNEAQLAKGGRSDAPAAYDLDMGDGSGAAPDNAPTGPKNLRGGHMNGRGSRIMGQVNRAMDRTNESVLHRVRQQSGSERINSHVRGAPKGPRNVQNRNLGPGMQKAVNGMGLPGNGIINNSMMNAAPPGQMPMPISPQQQMEMMAMMEQSARMMAQFMPGMMPPTVNPSFQQNGGQQGKSLFDRVEAGPGKRGRGGRTQRNGSLRHNSAVSANGGDTAMDLSEKPSGSAPSSSMEAESSQPQAADPTTTMCRFNLRCTNKTCPFVHQSPAAPEGITVDMTDTCSFGAACKSPKCTGRHPSSAQIKAHQSEEQCKFFPYCTNPTCPFKHPSMPMCRNGADCTVPHCKFTHLQTPCKFNPCKNVRCPYKHEEGQRGSYADKVWTAEGTKKEDDQHVSERKFVEDDGEEELIRAEEVAAQAAEDLATQAAGLIT